MTKDFALPKEKSNPPVYFPLLHPVVSLGKQHDFVKSKYVACDRFGSTYMQWSAVWSSLGAASRWSQVQTPGISSGWVSMGGELVTIMGQVGQRWSSTWWVRLDGQARS